MSVAKFNLLLVLYLLSYEGTRGRGVALRGERVPTQKT